MTDITPFTELKRIVSYALDEMDMSDAEFDKAWIFAFRGYIDMGFDISFEPKTVRLSVNSLGNKTVPFPSGCLSISKVGILDNNGQLSALKLNNALTTWKDQNPNRIGELTPDISDSLTSLQNAPVFFNYYYNGNYSNLFGVRTGLVQYGEYTIDYGNKLIVLSPEFNYNDILVECIIAPEKDNDYQIETCLQEAIIEWIKWKFKKGNDQSYYAAVIKGRRRLPKKKFNLSSANQFIRESVSMSILS